MAKQGWLDDKLPKLPETFTCPLCSAVSSDYDAVRYSWCAECSHSAIPPNFFAFGNFISPITFDPVKGAGFRDLLIVEINREDFERRFANVTQVHHEHVAQIERRVRDFKPAAETVGEMLDWAAQWGSPWSVAAQFGGDNIPTLTLSFMFPTAVAAVEFKLLFS